ncbi:hypothetical protein PINS_up014248 [Pythium insidiosum]|nr:hypothetical protein PINS_up014248 [Pythium insidiosum]
MEIYDDDEFFVLIGVHTLARAAITIQRFYRKRARILQPSDGKEQQQQIEYSTAAGFSSSMPPLPNKSSFMDPRARIAKYLAP